MPPRLKECIIKMEEFKDFQHFLNGLEHVCSVLKFYQAIKNDINENIFAKVARDVSGKALR